MKYLIVIVLALVNFALQAEDQSSAETQVLAMSFPVSSEVISSQDAASLTTVDAGVGSEVSSERTYASADGAYAGSNAPSPAFIWIFGSLIAGLFALASGRFIKNQHQ